MIQEFQDKAIIGRDNKNFFFFAKFSITLNSYFFIKDFRKNKF